MEGGHGHTIITTLCAAAAGGIFLTVLSRHLKVPAIILLLAGGILLGPEGIGLVQPDNLGEFLPVLVSLAVGLILFEGGLTLDLAGFSGMSRVIKRLLTVGVVVTWLLSGFIIWLIFRVEPGFALLCGSLIIVTGPTVIVPLLKRLQVNAKIHGILHWEGVLIDSIGVFIALLCFEWMLGGGGEKAALNFAVRSLSGLAIGFGGGWLTARVLHTRLVPEAMKNLFTLAAAVSIFGATEAVITEAGLLSVTVAGLVVGWKQPVGLKQVREFKGEITDLLIGLLFILLASRLELEQFADFGLQGIAAAVLIMLLVRPANILVSTFGSDLTRRERLFLSWVAPRGIVAASMSSLFALSLERQQTVANPLLAETFTYSVIVGTVILQGLSAGAFAKLLGLRRPVPTGWLVVGAHQLGRSIARFIQDETRLNVLLMDSNPRMVKEAHEEGFDAVCADALDVTIAEDRPEFQRIRFLLALTDNSELNQLICHRWAELLGRENVHRWSALKGDRPELDITHGVVVLPGMPQPAAVSRELANGDAQVEVQSVSTNDEPIAHQVLFAARNEQAIPGTHDSPNKLKPGDRILILLREEGLLAVAFQSGDVIDFVADSIDEVFAQVERTLRQRFDSLREDSLWDFPAHGKDLLLFLPGRSAALAHAYSGRLKQPVCILARLGEGLRVGERGEPLKLIFFLVSPESESSTHLETLSELARFSSRSRNIRKLLQLEKASDALAFLQSNSPAPTSSNERDR